MIELLDFELLDNPTAIDRLRIHDRVTVGGVEMVCERDGRERDGRGSMLLTTADSTFNAYDPAGKSAQELKENNDAEYSTFFRHFRIGKEPGYSTALMSRSQMWEALTTGEYHID